MRKQIDSNPPELQHNGRLNNSIVPGRKRKRPNALKHGLFSDAVLIPGEDSREYMQLLAELMDEYKPTRTHLARRGHRACEPDVEAAALEKIYANQAHCRYVRSS